MQGWRLPSQSHLHHLLGLSRHPAHLESWQWIFINLMGCCCQLQLLYWIQQFPREILITLAPAVWREDCQKLLITIPQVRRIRDSLHLHSRINSVVLLLFCFCYANWRSLDHHTELHNFLPTHYVYAIGLAGCSKQQVARFLGPLLLEMLPRM